MAVLVTGAGGFLGRRLVERFAALGKQVIAVARSPVPPIFAASANVKWIEKDIVVDGLKPDEISDADTIFHLAGKKELGLEHDESLFIKGNEELTLRLIHASAKLAKKFIFASSQMVYGNPAHVSVTEEFPLLGMESSAYACSKVNTENWLRYSQKQHGGLYISLRFCGFVEGGGSIDYMIDRALRNEPIELFSKGLVYRDYLPAAKGIDAFVAASSYESNPGFEVFNIGSGAAISTYDMAELICSELASESKLVLSTHPAPRADFVFNISKAIQCLAFNPGNLREHVRIYAHRKKLAFERGAGHA